MPTINLVETQNMIIPEIGKGNEIEELTSKDVQLQLRM